MCMEPRRLMTPIVCLNLCDLATSMFAIMDSLLLAATGRFCSCELNCLSYPAQCKARNLPSALAGSPSSVWCSSRSGSSSSLLAAEAGVSITGSCSLPPPDFVFLPFPESLASLSLAALDGANVRLVRPSPVAGALLAAGTLAAFEAILAVFEACLLWAAEAGSWPPLPFCSGSADTGGSAVGCEEEGCAPLWGCAAFCFLAFFLTCNDFNANVNVQRGSFVKCYATMFRK